MLLQPRGVRSLSVGREEWVPYDLVVALWASPCGALAQPRLYGDFEAPSAKQYFRESVSRFVRVIKSKEIFPVWRPEVEQHAAFREFYLQLHPSVRQPQLILV